MKKIILGILLSCVIFIQNVYAEPVDINSADAKTIAENLKGVGLKKATRIVEFRLENGPFRTIDDITKVKGIGPKILEQNKSYIVLTN
ncbi:MAG: ComEA family DNA-binding protein [Gammaproteobacteria bacterium]